MHCDDITLRFAERRLASLMLASPWLLSKFICRESFSVVVLGEMKKKPNLKFAILLCLVPTSCVHAHTEIKKLAHNWLAPQCYGIVVICLIIIKVEHDNFT